MNVRKYTRKVGRVVKKRYFKGKGYSRPKVNKMLQDVNYLKTMLNAEKKRVHLVSAADQEVGQVNENASGHWFLDITPNPPQGLGVSAKTGNSIKLHASHFDMQFTSQANTISGMRLKVQIVKVEGLPFTNISDVLGKFIVPNRFITSHTIYDINSDRDQDYFKNFKVLKTKYINIRNEDIANQVAMSRIKFGLKYKNHHVKTNDDSSVLSQGQIFMIVLADRGNAGPTASTISRVPITQANTAFDFAYNIDHYYYDN